MPVHQAPRMSWRVEQVGNGDSPDHFEQLDQASPQPQPPLLQRCETKNLQPLLVGLVTQPTDALD